MELFNFGEDSLEDVPEEFIPLAERVRAQKVADVVGQEHITGEGEIIDRMLKNKSVFSMILWGPPGSGKTTLAKLIAKESGSKFYKLSAVSSGVKDLREVIFNAGIAARNGESAVLFIDEIHRYNKGQQDALLNSVEKGIIRLIGATTENPSFEVNSALLSRSKVLKLKPLSENALDKILDRALENDEIIRSKRVKITDEARKILLESSGGDARKMLNTLELAVEFSEDQQNAVISQPELKKALTDNRKKYDKSGDYHYDVISAFIKSLRGSDPDAAVYYLARMLDAGENPEFIARRLIIFASEDVGNASPNGIVMAQTCFNAVSVIGMPEARIILAQCTTYLASQPKSNASYMALNKAFETVEREGDNAEVPLHLRNAPTKMMKEFGFGKEYKYPHDFEGHFVAEDYLPEKIKNEQFYFPTEEGMEKQIKERLASKWKGRKRY
ncbi:MAG TPA: replication-associated recombination protein A [Clostridiales bacterium]|nr:replication-associated recombination protein A [Clostridiales bacterium]HQP71016.1 replication-associated recombination protein A [Clostridiales bacterium]